MSEELKRYNIYTDYDMAKVIADECATGEFVDYDDAIKIINDLRRQLEEAKRSCLCDWDGLNKAAQYLIEHPEYDMLQADATTTDGSEFEMTVVILRGNQNVVEPLRKAKQQLATSNAEVDRLREVITGLVRAIEPFEVVICRGLGNDAKMPAMDIARAALAAHGKDGE